MTKFFAFLLAWLPVAPAIAADVGEWSPYRLVPVRNVSIERQTGCDQPRPDGRPCPDETIVNFTVSAGGSCHRYLAQVRNDGGHATLAIWDSVLRNCTRPEESEHAVSTSVSGDFSRVSGLVLKNRIYIKVVNRP